MASSVFDRSDYPTLTESIYLNQASLGLLSKPTVEAMHRFLDDVGRHGNLHMSDDDEVAFLGALRERAGRLFHTESRHIAILSSASELLGQLPFLLSPPPGSKVIAVATDFPAITRPWLRLVERGECRVQFVEDNPEADLTTDLITEIDNQTSLIAVGSVQYATGSVIDVPRLRTATAKAGVRLVIDATQGAGAMETNLTAWHADVVVCSGYKWLGGHGGVAVGAIEPSILERTPPLPGWMGAPDPFEFDATRMLFADDARRYTQSTMSYVSVVGLTAALDQLLALDVVAVEDHTEQLAHLLVGAVGSRGWRPFRELDDPAASPHIISLACPGDDAVGILARLRDTAIVCSYRRGRVRVSLAGYNNESDIDALVNALA
jgi:selenocysteine lyase/cysteine desulfurase